MECVVLFFTFVSYLFIVFFHLVKEEETISVRSPFSSLILSIPNGIQFVLEINGSGILL